MVTTFTAVTNQPDQLRAEIYATVVRTSPEFFKNRFSIHRTDTENEYLIYFEQDPTEKENTIIADTIRRHEPDPNYKYYTAPATGVRPALVKVLEQDTNPKVRIGGRYQMTTLKVDIPSGSPGDVVTKDYSFPIPISILAAQLLCAQEIIRDVVNFEVAPDTILGVLTEDVGESENVIKVSQTVIDNTFVGAFLSITDGVNVNNLGRVTNIGINDGYGLEDNAIKMETPTTRAFSASSPTYVRQTIKFAHDFVATCSGRVEVGETKIGSSFVPANTTLRLRYKNSSGTAKFFGIIIEYLY